MADSSLPDRIATTLDALAALDLEFEGIASRDLAPRQALFVVVRDLYGGGFVRPGNAAAVAVLTTAPCASARLAVLADAHVRVLDDDFTTTALLVTDGVTGTEVMWDGETDLDRGSRILGHGGGAGYSLSCAAVELAREAVSPDELANRAREQLAACDRSSGTGVTARYDTCVVFSAETSALLRSRGVPRNTSDETPSGHARRLTEDAAYALAAASPRSSDGWTAWIAQLARHMGLPPIADEPPSSSPTR